MFKFDIHLHTEECSACAIATAAEVIDAAVDRGFSGIVITDHFYRGNTSIDRNLPWIDFVGAFENNYLKAREYGLSKGITVLFGLEEGLGGGKEVLIYGLEAKDFKDCPDFKNFDLARIYDFVSSRGGLVIQPHPFRSRDYIPNPDETLDHRYLDGVEGYNMANPQDENIKAFEFAHLHKLAVTAGSDSHRKEDIGLTGLAFHDEIKDNASFVAAIKGGRYSLFIKGNILEEDAELI